MSDKKKLLGCGCASCGCGCLTVALIAAVVLFFAYRYLQTDFRKYASETLINTISKNAERAFNKNDFNEIKTILNETASKITKGDVGLFELLVKGSKQITDGAHAELLLLELKSLNFLSNKDIKAQNLIDKLVFNIYSGAVSPDAVASITGAIIQQTAAQEKGKTPASFSVSVSKKLTVKQNLSDAEKDKLIAVLQGIIDANHLKEPAAGFNANEAVKNKLIGFIKSLGASKPKAAAETQPKEAKPQAATVTQPKAAAEAKPQAATEAQPKAAAETEAK